MDLNNCGAYTVNCYKNINKKYLSQSVILFFYVQMNCARTEVHIFQLIHFARESNHVDDFIDLNELMTAKLLKQGNRFHKFKKKQS